MSGSAARSVLGYNLGRFALFVACLFLGYFAGLRSILLIVVALVVSGVLSYFLLARQRVAMAAAVTNAVTKSRTRLAERTTAEDAYVDALHAGDDPQDVTRPDR